MSTTVTHVSDHRAGIIWASVGDVAPVALLARLDRLPVGIVELLKTGRFRSTTYRGALVGEFATLEEGQRALEDKLRPAHADGQSQ